MGGLEVVQAYARMPDRKVEAMDTPRSAWPNSPCFGGPEGWFSISGLLRLRPAPRSCFPLLSDGAGVEGGGMVTCRKTLARDTVSTGHKMLTQVNTGCCYIRKVGDRNIEAGMSVSEVRGRGWRRSASSVARAVAQ